MLSIQAIEKGNTLNLDVVIICQRGCPEVEKIVSGLNPRYIKIFTPERESESVKSLINRNIHTGLQESFSRGADYVVVIEDDIEISPGFIHFVDTLQKDLGSDPSFRAINGFSANNFKSEISTGYGKYRFGVGWGWSINRNIWKKLSEFWTGKENAHWDGLIEPYIRTGFVVMPNHSLIVNHGLKGNGSNSANDPEFDEAITSSFQMNQTLASVHWQYNQVDINWRGDCFDFLAAKNLRSFLVNVSFRILFLTRHSSESDSIKNRIRSHFKALIFRVVRKLS
jgi:hypothetical protein